MQTQSFSSDMQTTPEAAVAAAKAMAGKAAPKGMIQKIANVNVVDLNGMFVATVIVLLEPDPQAEPEQEAKDGDGKTESGEGEADKSNKANDVHYVAAAHTRPQDETAAAILLQNQAAMPDTALPQTPIVQSMEQLPDPDPDLLNPEIPDTALGPETLGDEAVAMAEEMRNEFNDRPEEILLVGQNGLSPGQQASNEAHNQKELDAEETRREIALNNAVLAQDDVRPDPLT